jgi:hypothetical protein
VRKLKSTSYIMINHKCAGQFSLLQTTTTYYFILDDFTLRTSAEGARSKRFC